MGEKCSGENDCWVTARGNEETEQSKRELSCSEPKRGESYTIQGCKKHATRTTVPTTTQYSHLHEQHRQFQLVPGDCCGGDAGPCFLKKFRGIQRVRVVSLHQPDRLTGTTEVDSSAETGTIPGLILISGAVWHY